MQLLHLFSPRSIRTTLRSLLLSRCSSLQMHWDLWRLYDSLQA